MGGNNYNLPLLKKELDERYRGMLLPFATKEPRKDAREHREDIRPKENRTDFQRDRDRIIHSKAFRRLMYKTQVFVNHEGDHFRTRLTHTLEVAQFARGVSKSLGVNEELAEAIALGHDLGHTPFGHAVERYLDNILKKEKEGRFCHNEQSVRVVDFLEKRVKKYNGLNLTYEVREGILKHNRKTSGIYKGLNQGQVCSTIEGQIVKYMDTIAYTCHDLEDAIKSGLIEGAMSRNEDIRRKVEELIELIAKILEKDTSKITVNKYGDTYYIAELIHKFIMELTEQSSENINSINIKTAEEIIDLAGKNKKVIIFESNKFEKIRTIVESVVYKGYTIQKMDKKAVAVVTDLFEDYSKNPELLPPEWLYRYKNIGENEYYDGAKNNEIRVICDYISTMTDRYALEVHDSLRNPRVKV